MSNSVNLALDVTKTDVQNTSIKIRQGDGGFETLHTTVTSNGEPMDLQGWKITFMGTTAGNHKIIDDNVKIVEAPNGIFEYTPSKVWGMDIGYFKIAYFKFVKGDGSASSANFRVNVIEAIDLTQEEAQNYISVVDATISEIDKRLNDSLANVTQSIAENSSAASSLAVNVSSVSSSAVNQINDTASSAVYNVDSVASNVVNNVNSTASSAVDNVNNIASDAVNNVNVAASNATSSIASSVNTLGSRVDDYNKKLAAVKVGGRNYILNSKRAFVGSGVLKDLDWVNTSIPITSFSNKTITISFQVDYDNVTSVSDRKSVAFEIQANQINPDGTKVKKYFGIWKTVSVGDDFHGRLYATFDMSNVNLESIDTSQTNRWLGGLYILGVTGTNVSVSDPKIEIGNVPTDWTPAPEDAPNTILAGNYGIRVTPSGFQKTTDGKTWVSANI